LRLGFTGFNTFISNRPKWIILGVNDNINTKVIAHSLSRDLFQSTPTKRIPIDTHTMPNAASRTSSKAESKMESKDTNATKVRTKVRPQ